MPWIQLLRSAWSEYERDYAGYFAVAIVYYALVSFVPLLLLLLATLGFLLGASQVAASLERQLLDTIDANFGPQLSSTIEQSLSWLQQQSVTAAIVSVAALLLAASVLFRHLRMTFRAVWKRAPPLIAGRLAVVVRITVLERVVSFAIVLVASVLLVVVAGLTIVFQHFLNETIRWIVPLLVTVLILPFIFAMLFKVLPPLKLQLRHVWLASLLCATAWLLGTEVLALYGTYFSKNLGTYGALGGLLALMLWMKIMSQVLFLGAELCKVSYGAQPP